MMQSFALAVRPMPVCSPVPSLISSVSIRELQAPAQAWLAGSGAGMRRMKTPGDLRPCPGPGDSFS